MDIRQAQINTFSGGLNTDLHPLTTPNTILTDCINGTIITYNGNEFILQNDMGNVELNEAKLSKGFVPIGMKEYNGILYIMSFNPYTKQTEVGTFPSPKQYKLSSEFSTTKETNLNDFLANNNQKYSEINFPIEFYSHLDNFIINPGDKYTINIDNKKTMDGETINDSSEEILPDVLITKFFSLTTDKSLIEQTNIKADGKEHASPNKYSYILGFQYNTRKLDVCNIRSNIFQSQLNRITNTDNKKLILNTNISTEDIDFKNEEKYKLYITHKLVLTNDNGDSIDLYELLHTAQLNNSNQENSSIDNLKQNNKLEDYRIWNQLKYNDHESVLYFFSNIVFNVPVDELTFESGKKISSGVILDWNKIAEKIGGIYDNEYGYLTINDITYQYLEIYSTPIVNYNFNSEDYYLEYDNLLDFKKYSLSAVNATSHPLNTYKYNILYKNKNNNYKWEPLKSSATENNSTTEDGDNNTIVFPLTTNDISADTDWGVVAIGSFDLNHILNNQKLQKPIEDSVGDLYVRILEVNNSLDWTFDEVGQIKLAVNSYDASVENLNYEETNNEFINAYCIGDDNTTVYFKLFINSKDFENKTLIKPESVYILQFSNSGSYLQSADYTTVITLNKIVYNNNLYSSVNEYNEIRIPYQKHGKLEITFQKNNPANSWKKLSCRINIGNTVQLNWIPIDLEHSDLKEQDVTIVDNTITFSINDDYIRSTVYDIIPITVEWESCKTVDGVIPICLWDSYSAPSILIEYNVIEFTEVKFNNQVYKIDKNRSTKIPINESNTSDLLLYFKLNNDKDYLGDAQCNPFFNALIHYISVTLKNGSTEESLIACDDYLINDTSDPDIFVLQINNSTINGTSIVKNTVIVKSNPSRGLTLWENEPVIIEFYNNASKTRQSYSEVFENSNSTLSQGTVSSIKQTDAVLGVTNAEDLNLKGTLFNWEDKYVDAGYKEINAVTMSYNNISGNEFPVCFSFAMPLITSSIFNEIESSRSISRYDLVSYNDWAGIKINIAQKIINNSNVVTNISNIYTENTGGYSESPDWWIKSNYCISQHYNGDISKYIPGKNISQNVNIKLTPNVPDNNANFLGIWGILNFKGTDNITNKTRSLNIGYPNNIDFNTQIYYNKHLIYTLNPFTLDTKRVYLYDTIKNISTNNDSWYYNSNIDSVSPRNSDWTTAFIQCHRMSTTWKWPFVYDDDSSILKDYCDFNIFNINGFYLDGRWVWNWMTNDWWISKTSNISRIYGDDCMRGYYSNINVIEPSINTNTNANNFSAMYKIYQYLAGNTVLGSIWQSAFNLRNQVCFATTSLWGRDQDVNMFNFICKWDNSDYYMPLGILPKTEQSLENIKSLIDAASKHIYSYIPISPNDYIYIKFKEDENIIVEDIKSLDITNITLNGALDPTIDGRAINTLGSMEPQWIQKFGIIDLTNFKTLELQQSILDKGIKDSPITCAIKENNFKVEPSLIPIINGWHGVKYTYPKSSDWLEYNKDNSNLFEAKSDAKETTVYLGEGNTLEIGNISEHTKQIIENIKNGFIVGRPLKYDMRRKVFLYDLKNQYTDDKKMISSLPDTYGLYFSLPAGGCAGVTDVRATIFGLYAGEFGQIWNQILNSADSVLLSNGFINR